MTFREWLEWLDRRHPKPPAPPVPLPPKPLPGPPSLVVPDEIAARLLALHNDYRRRRGLGSLALDARLMAAARCESEDCARRRKLDHQGSDGSWSSDRISQAGYRWSWEGENIAWNQPTPEQAFDGWVNSPGHLKEILDPRAVHAGFAVARDAGGSPFWTAVFASPAT